MKKIYTLICFLMFTAAVGKAQNLFIPDTAVRTYLKQVSTDCNNWLFANKSITPVNCWIGDSMITNSFSTVIYNYEFYNVEIAIVLSNKNVTNMEGLQYIPTTTIDLSHNLITDAGYKVIPTTTTTSFSVPLIDFSYNLLTSIINTAIPSASLNLSHNLIADSVVINKEYGILDLSYNKITAASIGNTYYTNLSLPSEISLSHNLLSTFPTIAPTQWYNTDLYKLDLSYNNITSIKPNTIQATGTVSASSNLGKLILSGNNFTTLSADALLNLRKNAYYFNEIEMQYCNLSTFPELYEGVLKCDCSNNYIYCLSRIPSSLTNIIVDAGKVGCVPNIGSYNINSIPSSTYPLCNPTNNNHQCHGYPSIEGRVFNDINKNGIRDGNESYISNVKVQLSSNLYTFSDDSGYYKIFAIDTGVSIITVNAPNLFTAIPANFVYHFSHFDTAVVGNIALQPNVIKDSLSINITNINRLRHNFATVYEIDFRNVGTTDVNASVTFNYIGSQLHFDSSSNAAVSKAGNTLTLNVSNFLSGKHGRVLLYFTVLAVAGDVVTNTATITGGTAIATDGFSKEVTGSFDPNEKEATATINLLEISQGKYIDYTIHFQNTGNDTAFTVVIADTLSNKLKANTFEIVEASHQCKASIIGNIVYFEFSNILLPDSNENKLGSNGFVSFKIKTNSLVAGDSINNKSSIYFDYNKPVVTNTATTKVIATPLPVKLQSFTAKLLNKNVLLNWLSANEINMDKYIIEKSVDGSKYNTLGSVNANNKDNSVYQFTDEQPSKPANYYRLKMMENTGKYSYSEVKQLRLNQLTNQLINLFPNPTKDNLTIESKGVKTLVITDCFGRTILQLNNITEHQTINTKQWNKGIYIISFDNGEKVKVVKE